MAKIKGIELKSINTYVTPEDHLVFSANIYMDNKKVGEAYDDGWGGDTSYRFYKEGVKEEIISRAKDFYNDNPEMFCNINEEDYMYLDNIIDDLSQLKYLEKIAKKDTKKGQKFLVYVQTELNNFNNGDILTCSNWNDNVKNKVVKNIEEKNEKIIKLYVFEDGKVDL